MKIFNTLLILTIPGLYSCALTRIFNSGSFNIKYTKSTAKIEGELYENTDRLGNVSFSVRQLQHPKRYGKWNFNISISPSIHLDDLDYQTGATYINGQGNLTTRPVVNYLRLSGLANLKMTTHTPIGAFALSLGFGGNVSRIKNHADIDTIQTREIRRIDLAWYAFLSKRFFILTGPRYYLDNSEQFVWAIRLGAFWGKI